mmetsp:Transcript_8456/g.12691  ORF Transcript_8456/g.12691 Transcript_8456/m.12691 type:complete len:106 (-) Transcript_8456:582-899(-)
MSIYSQPCVFVFFLCFILFNYWMISLIACVRIGNTFGSLSMGRHAMGPSLLYVRRKFSTASLLVALDVMISIRITVSGDRSPRAVGNDGRVSLDDNTELDKGAPF